jgi:hypothetical protein
MQGDQRRGVEVRTVREGKSRAGSGMAFFSFRREVEVPQDEQDPIRRESSVVDERGGP